MAAQSPSFTVRNAVQAQQRHCQAWRASLRGVDEDVCESRAQLEQSARAGKPPRQVLVRSICRHPSNAREAYDRGWDSDGGGKKSRGSLKAESVRDDGGESVLFIGSRV